MGLVKYLIWGVIKGCFFTLFKLCGSLSAAAGAFFFEISKVPYFGVIKGSFFTLFELRGSLSAAAGVFFEISEVP